MAKVSLAPKSKVRPARDPAAPWAANARRQRRESTGKRAVVYCVTVEGMPLVKIGRSGHLKSRIAKLKSDTGRDLHIAYWAEFSTEDAKDVERCALLRMRRYYDSEGEWSLAEGEHGADAICRSAEFLGVRPEFAAGDPSSESEVDEYEALRRNVGFQNKRATGKPDRYRWENSG